MNAAMNLANKLLGVVKTYQIHAQDIQISS